MSRIVIIDGIEVVNVIEAESLEIAEELTGLTAVVSDTAGIGFTYDPETGEFTEPVIPEAPVLAESTVADPNSPIPTEEPAAPTEA